MLTVSRGSPEYVDHWVRHLWSGYGIPGVGESGPDPGVNVPGNGMVCRTVTKNYSALESEMTASFGEYRRYELLD